jgi:uncharacterized membrane protein YfcA
LAAFRHNLAPILLIQAGAVALITAFSLSSGTRHFLEKLGDWKLSSGLAGAAVTGAIAGGLLPEVAKALTRRQPSSLGKAAYTALLYAVMGVLVDILYLTLANLYGNGTDAGTLAKKVVTDMGLFTPFISIPLAVGMMTFFNQRFSWPEVVKECQNPRIRMTYLSSLVMSWCFWIPVLACVYAFPTAIQFPVAMLAEGAWSVLFVFMNSANEGS